MKTIKLLTIALCASLTLMTSSTVNAHADHTDALIKERKKGFKVMGKSMRAVGKMMKSGDVDMAIVANKIKAIKVQSLKLPNWFAKESSSESYSTEALPAIWADKADFIKKAKALQDAAKDAEKKLKQDDFQLRAAMLQIKKACGSCHDKYKAD